MQIDLFTLIAQIVNFLILLLLLRLLLYKHIIRAMDMREQKIASRLEEAEQKEKEALRESDAFRIKNQEIDSKRNMLISQAEKEAEARRIELIQAARSEVEKDRDKWRRLIQQQKKSFLTELKQRAGEQIYEITRRILNDMADAALEKQVIKTFIRRFRQMDEVEREAVGNLSQKKQDTIVITSSFEIPQDMRKKITEVIMEQIGSDFGVKFKESAELICGIELDAGGRKIIWSFDSYLDTLEDYVSRVIEKTAGKKNVKTGI